MKTKLAGGLFLFGALAILFSPGAGWSQRGGPPGGDPNRMFEMLSKGRGYFLAEDMRMFREPMTQWLQKRGITDGKVTRDLYMAFQEEARSNPGGIMTMFGKGSPSGFKSGFGGPFPGGPGGPMPFMPGGPGRGGAPSELSINELSRWGEMEFRRKDFNSDNYLTPEEMEPKLRDNVQTWDSDRDGLIKLDEFQRFFLSKMQERNGQGAKFNPVTIIIEEELLDKRPTMFRAGKDVPREIKWFGDLDADKDGQVSFYEWRKAKKDMDEFTDYDRNADGLLTAEEALYYQRKNGSTMLAGNSSDNSASLSTDTKNIRPMRIEGAKNGVLRIDGGEKNKGNSSGSPRSEGSFKGKGGPSGKVNWEEIKARMQRKNK